MPKKDWMIKESDLDDDQLHVFNAILDKSCIVIGCAGSGKSVLALIKAQRIQKEKGNNYQVIVYTKSLCRYMNAGRQTLGLQKDFYYHWDWVNKKGMPSADYTIVDEIQDFTKEEIGQFINATHKQFFFFGDTAQSIYKEFKDTIPVEYILYEFPHCRINTKQFDLYRNYRLPLSTAKLSQHIGEDLPPFVPSIYQSKESQKPFLLKYNNDNDQIASIVDIVKKRGFEDVGIFMPDNNSLERLQQMFKNNGMDVEVRYSKDGSTIDTLNFNTTLPKIMTYHSAKGLQFETVFIPMLPPVIRHRSALYVAMTRTYHYLYLMYSGVMPDLLRQASSNEYLTTTDVVVEDK